MGSSTRVLRDELRIESAVGYVVVTRNSSVFAALEPYLAFELEDKPRYQQWWGVVSVVTVAARLPFGDD